MFFVIRLIALAVLGPWALNELEQRPAFGVLLSAISVVVTAWVVLDVMAMLSALQTLARS